MNPEMTRILVVDDDAELRSVMCDLFTGRYEVLSASSGQEAIALLQNNKIDLVFSDILMPNGSGIDVLDWVCKSKAPRASVVLVSGHSTLSPEAARDRGALQLIAKPFRARELLDIAASLTAKQK